MKITGGGLRYEYHRVIDFLRRRIFRPVDCIVRFDFGEYKDWYNIAIAMFVLLIPVIVDMLSKVLLLLK